LVEQFFLGTDGAMATAVVPEMVEGEHKKMGMGLSSCWVKR
jgi:hypothetical protein